MLTGDKYDLFRPVCNRPEKKKTDGWGGRAREGLGGSGVGVLRFGVCVSVCAVG